MGTVVTFPDMLRDAPADARNDGQGEPATITILPVVRIERHGEGSPRGNEPGSKSRGKSRRSPVTRS